MSFRSFLAKGHDGAGDWDKEDAYEAKQRKARGEPEVGFSDMHIIHKTRVHLDAESGPIPAIRPNLNCVSRCLMQHGC